MWNNFLPVSCQLSYSAATINTHHVKPRLKPVSCQEMSTEQDSVRRWKICRIHRLCDSSPLCLRLGIHIRRVRRPRPGQPVAVGDQQISDVAVMPLMKLTQHSLPPRGPLRASCSACSTTNTPTPHPLHVSALCASDLMAASNALLHHLFPHI